MVREGGPPSRVLHDRNDPREDAEIAE